MNDATSQVAQLMDELAATVEKIAQHMDTINRVLERQNKKLKELEYRIELLEVPEE